ncbi:MAG TPA: restriction endonuclease [Candidatus Cloacimonadota bacterium]|nr:restriction endonuclease [Candidatus Cloacimonadota bacterium]
MKSLNIAVLKKEADIFAQIESSQHEKSIYGTTDGKAIGTYFEHKFQAYLKSKYTYQEGNSARGIDFPELEVDMKTTSIKQPQSSCPFRSAEQKIYGLGYSLLVFVYDKTDDHQQRTGNMNILHVIFVNKEHTADYQITRQICNNLDNDGNSDDIVALLMDKNLPVDDISVRDLAARILSNKPKIGYLTISNALQWRLQYSRIIEKAGEVEGVIRLK